jgi:hypothetical protein
MQQPQVGRDAFFLKASRLPRQTSFVLHHIMLGHRSQVNRRNSHLNEAIPATAGLSCVKNGLAAAGKQMWRAGGVVGSGKTAQNFPQENKAPSACVKSKAHFCDVFLNFPLAEV